MTCTQQTDPVESKYRTKESSDINRTTDAKDFEAFMSDGGEFYEKIMESSVTGKTKAGLTCEVFNTCNEGEVLILYKALVLRLLECNCSLWCPTNQNNGLIRVLKSVRKSFTNRILVVRELIY